MDTNQPTDKPNENITTTPAVQTPVNAAPGLLTTKMPSTIAFAVAILLFLMPFVDIKCNGSTLQTVTGLQLATGFTMKDADSGNNFLTDSKDDKTESKKTKSSDKADKKDPNIYALIALGLGILGLGLSFTNAKAALTGAMVTGVAAAGALVGLMIDIKSNMKTDIPSTNSGDTGGDLGAGLDNFGKSMSDKLNITVDFTSWFYIALIIFLAAAFFCYKRLSENK